MNKKINKIIIFIACVILAIVGFSIYSVNTKNTNTEVKTEEKQEPTVEKGDEPKTDTDTELTDVDKEGMSAVNVFMQGFQQVFNVEDTKNVDVNSYNFLTENGKQQVKNFYTYSNSYKLNNLQIIKVVSNHENKNNKDGYLIYYKNTILADNKEDLLENEDGVGFATAWIPKQDDNSYKIEFFNNNKFTTLDE